MADDAFVILTHFVTPRIRTLIARSREELRASHDVWVIGRFADDAVLPPEFQGENMRALRAADVCPAHYPRKGRERRKMGDNDLQVLWLAREMPHYRSIWLIEGDVDFTGSLARLVRHFEDVPADLLTTNLRPPRSDWANAHRNGLPAGWPEEFRDGDIGLLAAFRASRALLDRIERFYSDGGNGHNEWTWPYVARASGLTVADLKDFPIDGRPVYTSSPAVPGLFPGSFRYRPPMAKPGRRPMTLWHPVKDRPVGAREYADQIVRATWQLARNAVRGRR